MAERPLLILPNAESIGPPRLGGGGERPITPTREAQARRIGPPLGRLREALERGPDRILELRYRSNGASPRSASSCSRLRARSQDFARAAARVPGLELMVEFETEAEPDEYFAVKDTRAGHEGERREDKLVEGRFTLAMPDIAALNQLIGLWDRWAAGQEAAYGLRAVQAPLCAAPHRCGRGGRRTAFPTKPVEYWREEARRQPDRAVRTGS